tara:strand:+ start:26 stop:211 length:186 start_codon:yes stop_codon:yes gene_type:complete
VKQEKDSAMTLKVMPRFISSVAWMVNLDYPESKIAEIPTADTFWDWLVVHAENGRSLSFEE